MPCKDRETQRASSKKHYESHREAMKLRAKQFTSEARRRNRKFITDYLNSHPCVDCGNDDRIVLEFDHVRGKKSANVSTGAGEGWSIKRLEQEIAKCDVRCANCHRRVTHQRLNMK